MINNIDWETLDQRVRIEQANRETYSPVISTFRWWARRSHAVMGAILDAAEAEYGAGFKVADPFSGGGTVAIESVIRGLQVYAQDLYPWPAFGLATAIGPCDPNEFEAASNELLSRVDHLRRYYRRAGQETTEITHIIRVRTARCRGCAVQTYRFADPLITVASRSNQEPNGYFGCVICGSVTLAPVLAAQFVCQRCDRQWSTVKDANTITDSKCRCMPEHQQPFELSWHPVLVQERDITNSTRTKSTIRPVEIGDPVEDNRNDVEIPLLADIPPGIETNHLIDAGFRCWSDLYSVRQLDALSTALTEVRALAYSKRVRDRLALAVLNTAELPAYVCRWDRFHPKIFEAMANHRYSRSNVVVEANLLSPVGRGTLPRRLRSSASALTWLLERRRELPPVRNAVIGRHSRASSRDVTVVTGSSRRQLIATGSAKLVLTDPPYHDDVQYGELARLFHAWLEVYQRLGAIDECEEAVPNRTRELGASHFLDTIADCLAESRRSLAVDGRLVLTFHNNNRRAWEALQVALRRAELVVLEIAAVTAENKADHSKRGNKVFLSDLVIECGHKANRDQSASLMVVRPPTTNEERNLVAAGMALADHVNDSIDMHFMMRYQLHLERLGGTAALIR